MKKLMGTLATLALLAGCVTPEEQVADSQPTKSLESEIPLVFAKNVSPFSFADTAYPSGTTFQLIDSRTITNGTRKMLAATPFGVWVTSEGTAVPFMMVNVSTKLGLGLDKNLCTNGYFLQANAFGKPAPVKPYHPRLTPPVKLCFERI